MGDGAISGSRYNRHRRAKRDWGTGPSRSEEVRQAAQSDPEPAKRAPTKKDTKAWCKGKPGVEHVQHLVFVPDHSFRPNSECQWACRWSLREQGYRLRWSCHHREQCERCGKVFRVHWQLRPDECPDYPGSPEQKAAAEAQVVYEEERYAGWLQTWEHRQRKPVISAPQGYRRKRASGSRSN